MILLFLKRDRLFHLKKKIGDIKSHTMMSGHVIIESNGNIIPLIKLSKPTRVIGKSLSERSANSIANAVCATHHSEPDMIINPISSVKMNLQVI